MWNRVRSSDKKNNRCYARVTIDSRWESYDSFLKDMGECPPKFSLDRIDNNKGYCKDNCRWIPVKHQGSNTSRCVQVTLNGVTATISQHCNFIGIDPNVVYDRINKLKWPLEKALMSPVRPCKKKNQEKI